jgi:hypothetical protein
MAQPKLETPTVEDVEIAMVRMKNNKAPGEDSLTTELIKNGGKSLLEKIHKLIKKIWEEEQMPTQWKIGLIYPLHKK